MNVLLTNDDGIYADGLYALHKRFSKNHSVTIVAPEREQSAVSHAITLREPLRADKIKVNGEFLGYAVNGTPADCIKLSILEILDATPDMVISGINTGANVGMDINYSGTVCAAKEAGLWGIPAIAVSRQKGGISRHDDVADFIEMLANHLFQKGLPHGTILNVNIPNVPLPNTAGVRISRQETAHFPEYFEKRIDPQNRVCYWQACDPLTDFKHVDSDRAALCQNFISITPIQCDMTDHGVIEDLKSWHIKKD